MRSFSDSGAIQTVADGAATAAVVGQVIPTTTTALVATTTAAAVVSDGGLVWQPSPSEPVIPNEDFIEEYDEPSRLLFIQQPLRRRHLAPEPTPFLLLKRQLVSYFYSSSMNPLCCFWIVMVCSSRVARIAC